MAVLKALYAPWPLAALTGCIWISKDDYIEEAGCDPWQAKTSSELGIRGSLSPSDLGEGVGVELDGAGQPYLGSLLATVGDLDGDGQGGWVVGGWGVILVGHDLPSAGAYTVNDDSHGIWTEVSAVPGGAFVGAFDGGDPNGDGERDLLAVRPYYDADATGSFGVFLLAGGDDLAFPANPLLKLDTDVANESFRSLSIAAFGELPMAGAPEGDGFSGVLVAGWLDSSQGALYAFTDAQLTDAWTSTPLSSGEWGAPGDGRSYEDTEEVTTQLGWATVSRGGDVDGEGTTDALLGAPSYDGKGAAFLIRGQDLQKGSGLTLGEDGGLDIIWKDTDATASLVGFAVSTAGDLDGDGYADVLVGTHQGAGEARLYRGGVALAEEPEEPMVTFTVGDAAVTDLGNAVAGGGDLDSDCYPDVVLGGLGVDEVQMRYVFLGAELLDATNLTVEDGQPSFTQPALQSMEGTQTLATLADLNGDGYAEILSGAPEAGETDAGAAYFLFGGAPD